MSIRSELETALAERILVLDGAMGTTIRGYGLEESDARGNRFAKNEKDLLNNGDILSLTQPDTISDIHKRFYEAGSDICETNTFSGTTLAQSEFFVEDPRETGKGRKDPEFFDREVLNNPFLQDLAWEINVESAKLAKRQAEIYSEKTGRKRYVAGAIGPLTVSLSNSPDAEDAGFRTVTFDQVVQDYEHQVRALIEGGVDILMVETIFDSLNAKAALVAIQKVAEASRLTANHNHPPTNKVAEASRLTANHNNSSLSQDASTTLPIIISAAVGRGGETMISAQKSEALWNAIRHVNPLAVGLNCSLGPDLMEPFLADLSKVATTNISCYPNAGLPNPLAPTGFDLLPEHMADYTDQFCKKGYVNLIGGCCGNTPEHIAAIAQAAAKHKPRPIPQLANL